MEFVILHEQDGSCFYRRSTADKLTHSGKKMFRFLKKWFQILWLTMRLTQLDLINCKFCFCKTTKASEFLVDGH
jgi:hypothetical protein